MGSRSFAGYVAAVAGSLVGAASLGALLGWTLAYAGSGFEAVGLMAIGILLGTYAGSVVGCWAALRLFAFEAANATATVVAALAPIGIGAGVWVGGRVEGAPARIAALLGGVLLSATAARFLGPVLGDDARGGGQALGDRARAVTDRPDPAPWEAEEPFGR